MTAVSNRTVKFGCCRSWKSCVWDQLLRYLLATLTSLLTEHMHRNELHYPCSTLEGLLQATKVKHYARDRSRRLWLVGSSRMRRTR